MRTNVTNTTTYDLSLKQFFSQFEINLNYINSKNTSFYSILNDYSEREVLRLEHRVYCGKPQKEIHEVRYPNGWWNALKYEYPRIFRWFAPVRYTTVKVTWEGSVAFPELSFNSEYARIAVWNSPLVEELA